jgi:hypothetical protein
MLPLCDRLSLLFFTLSLQVCFLLFLFLLVLCVPSQTSSHRLRLIFTKKKKILTSYHVTKKKKIYFCSCTCLRNVILSEAQLADQPLSPPPTITSPF